jgi:hypothetical protein
MPKNIPVYSLNVPNGGSQQHVTIPPDQPIYSMYTGNQVGVGSIPFGTPTDVPVGHPYHGRNFHVITHNPTNNTFMTCNPFWR